MANRVLRDWTCSETIDQLSEFAELFFTRLIMKADDFGRFYGSTKILKSQLYPLKDYNLKEIEKWRNELVKSGIVILYVVDGKEYLEINDFNQRLRIMKSKFPEPLTNDGQLTDISPTDDGLKRKETKLETEEETETETNKFSDSQKIILFDSWWNLYDKKVGKEKVLKKWLKLSLEEINECLLVVSDYVKSTPDKAFRKNAETYLNGKHWKDEIITKQQNNGTTTQSKPTLDEQTDRLVERVFGQFAKEDATGSDAGFTEDSDFEIIG